MMAMMGGCAGCWPVFSIHVSLLEVHCGVGTPHGRGGSQISMCLAWSHEPGSQQPLSALWVRVTRAVQTVPSDPQDQLE